jgi:hypothetical protein
VFREQNSSLLPCCAHGRADIARYSDVPVVNIISIRDFGSLALCCLSSSRCLLALGTSRSESVSLPAFFLHVWEFFSHCFIAVY